MKVGQSTEDMLTLRTIVIAATFFMVGVVATITPSSVSAQFPPGVGLPSAEDFESIADYEKALLSWAMGVTRDGESEPGRYELVLRDELRADTFLLDTVTGRIWIRIEFTYLEGEPRAWVAEPRLDNPDDKARWVAKQPRKQQ